MKNSRLLTEAEQELMVILWEHRSASVREVVDSLERPRAYTSIATILRILEDKGFATSERVGRTLHYSAAIGRASYEARNLRHLVAGLFGGNPLALVRRLVDADALSTDDLAAMQQLIDERLGEE
ncbi:MAG: putative transcriptional regulator [Myxococcota bacterium]|jgi:predicted transcriptional regulator